MDDQIIYFDNASTTKPYDEVLEIINEYSSHYFFNPSGIYIQSQSVKKGIEIARESLAKIINCDKNEIFFTSGGTESNNWALKGIVNKYKPKGNHIITTKIEHHSIVNCCKYLEAVGINVTYLDVDENGFVDLEQLKKNINNKTILVSVIFANNEIGTIQNIEEIGNICKENNIIFHSDAVQAFGHLNIDVKKLNIDLLSVSGHKFGGPKGIGFLYKKKNVQLDNLIEGGGQERNKRGGTENVAGILGLAKAAEISYRDLNEKNKYLVGLRDYCINKIIKEIPYSRLNGHSTNRLSNNINISFQFIEGESLVLHLNKHNICCSTGSACSYNTLDPSHVLLAIGLPHELAHGSLRITLNTDNNKDQIDFFVTKLDEIVEKLRQLSPLYEDYKNK